MADEKKYIEQGAALDAVFGQFCASSDETERALNAAIEEIRAIPAADVVPVVRGRWVQTGGKYSRHKTIDRRILTCSVCGNTLYMEGVNAGRGDANFCPNCGAKMDKDGD